MDVISLTPLDLAVASALVLLLAGLSIAMRLGAARSLLIAAARTTAQLLLVGLVLEALFANVNLGWIALAALAMLGVAGYEVMRRQKHRLAGAWGYAIGALSMFVSSFSITVFALIVIIGPDPWYHPQYAIPLLGMMLGNTMNGISLSVDHLTATVVRERAVIEARLALGHAWPRAISAIRRDSMRVGLIPIINAMSAAGIVSLPGMMTGQILSGTPPVEAVKYQILIMFLIASITGLGALIAVALATRRLFDNRERLRLDRLKKSGAVSGK